MLEINEGSLDHYPYCEETGDEKKGHIINNGGTINLNYGYITAANNFESIVGVMNLNHGCVLAGQDFALDGAVAYTFDDITSLIGWRGEGDFVHQNATTVFNDVEIQIAGHRGDFNAVSVNLPEFG